MQSCLFWFLWTIWYLCKFLAQAWKKEPWLQIFQQVLWQQDLKIHHLNSVKQVTAFSKLLAQVFAPFYFSTQIEASDDISRSRKTLTCPDKEPYRHTLWGYPENRFVHGRSSQKMCRVMAGNILPCNLLRPLCNFWRMYIGHLKQARRTTKACKTISKHFALKQFWNKQLNCNGIPASLFSSGADSKIPCAQTLLRQISPAGHSGQTALGSHVSATKSLLEKHQNAWQYCVALLITWRPQAVINSNICWCSSDQLALKMGEYRRSRVGGGLWTDRGMNPKEQHEEWLLAASRYGKNTAARGRSWIVGRAWPLVGQVQFMPQNTAVFRISAEKFTAVPFILCHKVRA